MGNNRKKVQELTQPQLVTILNIFVPLISGAILAAFSLAQKHFNAQRYIFAYWPAWIYLILSSFGSLLITKVMQTVGTRVLQDDLLNSILQGLLGAAIFLGIVTKVPLPKSNDSDINESIKTIRDFLFDFLEKANDTRQKEITHRKIKDIVKKVEPAILTKEAFRLARGLHKQDADINNIVAKFDEFELAKDYYSMIHVLAEESRIDYIYEEMLSVANVDIEQEKKGLTYKGHTKIKVRGASQPGLSDLAIAKMFACQKEPEESLSYLRKALKKEPSIAKDIVANDLQWMIFTNMTKGEEQVEKLDEFLKLINFKRPLLRELRRHCYCHDSIKDTAFMAVKKSDGNCVRIVIQRLQTNQNDSSEWSAIIDKDLTKQFATFDEILDYIDEIVIPTKLVL